MEKIQIIYLSIVTILSIAGIIYIPFRYQKKQTGLISKNEKPTVSDKTLRWEISGNEQKERKRKSIIRTFYYSFPIFLASSVSAWFKDGEERLGMLIFSIIFITGFITVYFANLNSKPKSRKYELNEHGVRASFGDKNDFFEWKNFDFFYLNPNDATDKFDQRRNDYVTEIKNIRGEKLFLQLKNNNKFSVSKNVLVIYSGSENYKKVYELIKSIVPEKSISISGFVNYIYK